MGTQEWVNERLLPDDRTRAPERLMEIENAVPILVASSRPDNQPDCITPGIAEAPDRLGQALLSVRSGPGDSRPVPGWLTFCHATPDNMSLAERPLIVV